MLKNKRPTNQQILDLMPVVAGSLRIDSDGRIRTYSVASRSACPLCALATELGLNPYEEEIAFWNIREFAGAGRIANASDVDTQTLTRKHLVAALDLKERS